MSATVIIEAVGWAGAVLILASYVLLSMGKLDGRSVPYQVMNVVGAAGFIVNGLANGAMPSAVLNIIWMAMGLFTIWQVTSTASSK